MNKENQAMLSVIGLHIALKDELQNVQVSEIGQLMREGRLRPDAGNRFNPSRVSEIASLIVARRSEPVTAKRRSVRQCEASKPKAEPSPARSTSKSLSEIIFETVHRTLDASPAYQSLKAAHALREAMGPENAEKFQSLESVGQFEQAFALLPANQKSNFIGPKHYATVRRSQTGLTPKATPMAASEPQPAVEPDADDYAAQWAAMDRGLKAQYGHSFRAYKSWKLAVASGRVRFTPRDGSN